MITGNLSARSACNSLKFSMSTPDGRYVPKMGTESLLRRAAEELARQGVEASAASQTAKLLLRAQSRFEVDVADAISRGDLDTADSMAKTSMAKGIVALERGDCDTARRFFVSDSSAEAWLGLAFCERGEQRQLALDRSIEMDPSLGRIDLPTLLTL